MSNYYKQNISSVYNVLGFGKAKPADLIHHFKDEIDLFLSELNEDKYPAFTIGRKTDDLDYIQSLANNWRQKFDDFVVIGMGGSNLGGQVLVNFKQALRHGLTKPRIHFIDNSDPTTTDFLLKKMDMAKTMVLIISKSGGTVETVTQSCLFTHAFKKAALNPADHMILLTEPKESGLSNWAKSYGIQQLDHDPKIGGRYTVFSNVGLLPAAVAGVNIIAFRQGAADMMSDFASDPYGNKAIVSAALAVLANRRNHSVNVLFAYGDQMRLLGPWFVQLWAESLGKKGKGSTPLSAIGSVDQHSILQLFLDGPKDKFITILIPPTKGKGTPINIELAFQMGKPDFAGKTLGDLLEAQGHATAETLIENGLPVRCIELTEMTEKSLGYLMMQFMLETYIASLFFGVNAFDQPAVEQGKVRAMKILEETAAVS